MPDLLFDFENGAYSYFSFKDMKLEKEVSKVAGGLQDTCVQTWYRLNCAAVDAAGFPAFMKSVRESWLDVGWEQEVKLTILASHQGNTPISDWIMLLKSTNTLLLGHTCHLSKVDLRNHIQSHIHADTMTSTMIAELHLLNTYNKYKHALKVIDDARIRADELLKSALKQMMIQPANICHPSNPRHGTSSSSTTSNMLVSTTNSRTPNRVPSLTAVERALLVNHNGCFKCRHFYTTHKSSDCPDGFPAKATYVLLMESDALAAKRRHEKKGKAAVTAAVVSTPIAVVMPSAVLGDGSDSEYVHAPFFVPHYFWDCTVVVLTPLPWHLCMHSLIMAPIQF
jgi:hypothetical protein